MKKGSKWILAFAGAIIVVLLLRGFLFTSYIIPSSGMENALYEGDRILVNKWSYGLRLPLMSLFSYHRWGSSPVKRGDIAVFNNPASPGSVIDKKETFISRCIGTPGDTLLVNALFSVTSSPGVKAGPDRKKLYCYPKSREQQMEQLLADLSIANNQLMGTNEQENVRSFSRYEYYLLEQALGQNNWIRQFKEGEDEEYQLVIPGKGKTIEVAAWNATLIRNTIVLHEGVDAEVREGMLYIEGNPVQQYTFTKDYYWMASNNSINMADSRLFGFVPHDHIIGKASLIWFSKENNTGLFKGYRWKRFFRKVR